MANTDLAVGFEIFNRESVRIEKWPASASLASKDGDILFLDSAGRADDVAGVILGVQVGAIVDNPTGELNTTAAADDWVYVCTDSQVIMKVQISTGALTDPYTTNSSAACFDLAGSAGVQYINAGASSQDFFKLSHSFLAASVASLIRALTGSKSCNCSLVNSEIFTSSSLSILLVYKVYQLS